MHKKWKTLLAVACMAGAVFSNTAIADTYPSQAVTMVVPWPPGGPSDIGARPLAAHLHKTLGQSVVIDNRAGAGGNIGSNMVAKAKPDGYTLLLSSSGPFVINPYIYAKMPYDAEKDFTPVSNLLQVPLVLVVNPSMPVNNLQELLDYIKEKNGDFQWASAGNGTTQHLTGELFQMTTGLDMVHVPYKGTAPAITDLLGGHVPMMFDSTIAIVPHIKAGKVKPIAISSLERSPLLPDVPTFAEAGLPGMEASAWYGLFAPANTPAEVVNTLNKATLDFMQTSEYKRILDETGSRAVGDSPENFAAFIKQEAIKWKSLVEATNTKLD